MALDSVLARLRHEYAPVVRETVTELEHALAQMRSDGERSKAQRIAHRLSGTAGSYGFLDVGQAARVIEDALADLDSLERDDAGIDAALEALRRAAAALVTGAP